MPRVSKNNVQFQGIPIPPPQKVNVNSKGEGVAKEKAFKERYGANWNFLRSGWSANQNTLWEGGGDLEPHNSEVNRH